MEEKIIKWIKIILKMPLWVAILIFFCVISGYAMISDIYHQFRYHFSDIARTFFFWVILISGVYMICGIVYLVDYIKNKKK